MQTVPSLAGLWLVCSLFVFSSSAQAAQIGGRVVDSTSAPLPGVRVEITGPNLSHPIATTTNEAGWYEATVPPGRHEVTFTLINFVSVRRSDVESAGATTVTVDATLYLGASADVVVTARRTFRNLTELDEPENDLIGFADTASVGVITAAQIDRQPMQRPGELLETIPGVIVSQHSGEGKANQYYLRGFNLDHGTDIAITVAGVPVNLPTHAHGQGWADVNFMIPELVIGVQFKKGPYFATEGDFATAGAVNVNYASFLEKPVLSLTGGDFGYRRAVAAGSQRLGEGYLLAAGELSSNDGPWKRADDLRKQNGVLRYTTGDQRGGLSITAMAYAASWNSTDQVPLRAVQSGMIDRYGLIDASNGGETDRYSLSSEWQRSGAGWVTRLAAYGMASSLDLFSNFTYYLEDPVNGDQFEQEDKRRVFGGEVSHRWLGNIAGRRAESLAGLSLRRDDIHTLGLHRTRERQRLSTVRADSVIQDSAGLFAQTSIQWSRRLRTVTGLRADHYRFDVRSDAPANSGEAAASLLSPKVSIIFRPFGSTELYASAGSGFHSNDGRGTTQRVDPASGDATEKVDPLVRTRGAELGVRTKPSSQSMLALSLWGLDIDSELLFVGDAGATDASRPSRRRGFELEAYYNVNRWLVADADVAGSTSRFRDDDPAGHFIPGAVEGVASVGVSLLNAAGVTGSLRYRHFGPRPLIENNSVRSKASSTVNGNLGYTLSKLRIELDLINILDSVVSDVDYFYTSRLPGEAAAGFDDLHGHPLEPRSLRITLSKAF